MSDGGRARRVLFVECAEDGTTGGSHQSMYDVVRNLDRERYRPVVAFSEENRFVPMLAELGVPVHVLQRERQRERRAMETGGRARKGIAALGAIARRARLLRRESVDLLHLNNSPRVGLDEWVPAALGLGIPCVANAMGKPYALPEGGVRSALCRRYRRIRAISDHVAGELLAGGWDPRRVRTIPLSVDGPRFAARVERPAAEVRAKLGVAEGSVLIAMVGNIREWKGQHVVVEALAGLSADTRARIHVLFIGDTSSGDRGYHDALVARVGEAELSGCVDFLGSRTDVPDLVAASDVLLHASTSPEPFGLVVLEGMVLGKAVIAADAGGPREIVSGGSGLLFRSGEAADLASKLSTVANDPALRRSLGEAAVRRAAEFAIARETEALQDLYDEILGGARVLRRASA